MGLYNYQGSHVVEELSQNGKIVLKVYNDTGASIARGLPYVATEKFVSGQGIVMALLAPATATTESNVVGLILGGVDGTTSIANNSYGFLQIKGEFGNATDDWGAATSGTVAANDQLEVLNGGVALIDQGTDGGALIAPETVAVAIEEATTNVWVVYLLGYRAQIKAS